MDKKTIVFVREGIRRFKEVGTIVPLGDGVARAISELVGRSSARRLIVELGTGVGNLTSEIVKNLKENDFFVGLDSNAELIAVCRSQVAGGNIVIENRPAQEAARVVAERGLGGADVVVSSLPFRIFSPRTRREILENVAAVLKPGGFFIFVRYLVFPETEDLKRLDGFEVVAKKSVWLNFPPTEIVKMRKR